MELTPGDMQRMIGLREMRMKQQGAKDDDTTVRVKTRNDAMDARTKTTTIRVRGMNE